jgi:beta-phosphoglucomutase-like phosphatase (HAD superfamily)
MDSLSLSLDETLIIEDSKTGLLSAVRSNATVLGITTSLTKRTIKDIDKNIRIVRSYEDIKAYLENY